MTDPLDLPDWLRRDANNRAPWMGECASVDGLLCRKNYPGTSACTSYGGTQQCINPAASPPATAPNWVPPWAASSCSPPASPHE